MQRSVGYGVAAIRDSFAPTSPPVQLPPGRETAKRAMQQSKPQCKTNSYRVDQPIDDITISIDGRQALHDLNSGPSKDSTTPMTINGAPRNDDAARIASVKNATKCAALSYGRISGVSGDGANAAQSVKMNALA